MAILSTARPPRAILVWGMASSRPYRALCDPGSISSDGEGLSVSSHLIMSPHTKLKFSLDVGDWVMA